MACAGKLQDETQQQGCQKRKSITKRSPSSSSSSFRLFTLLPLLLHTRKKKLLTQCLVEVTDKQWRQNGLKKKTGPNSRLAVVKGDHVGLHLSSEAAVSVQQQLTGCSCYLWSMRGGEEWGVKLALASSIPGQAEQHLTVVNSLSHPIKRCQKTTTTTNKTATAGEGIK